MAKNKSDIRFKHYSKKSLHITCTLAEHAEFKKVLLDYGLSMQEVLYQCLIRITNGNDNYMKELLDECVEIRIAKKHNAYLEGDVENIYKLIESDDRDKRDNQ